MSRSTDIEALMKQGFNLLEECDYDGAIKIGKKLKALRHSSAFEILAIGYNEKGELGKAIKVLEEGVGKVPDVWLLWQLLGNYYSDKKRYADAHRAYESALTCPRAGMSSIHLNQAVVLFREKRYSEALHALEKVTDKKLELPAGALRIEVLTSLKRFEEAIEFGKGLVKKTTQDEADPMELARAFAALGTAEWEGRKDAESALSRAWKAIHLYKLQSDARFLIREIEAKRSQKSKYFRMDIEGTWPEPFEDESKIHGFFTSYDVVADTKKEALEFIKRFEPEEVRDSLKIDYSKVLESSSDDPKGVYHAAGYRFFPKIES